MGAMLDLTVAFIIIIIASVFSPMAVINARLTDGDTNHKFANVLQQAVDTATSSAQVNSATPGLLDNDGQTVTIAGNTITTYAGRPINGTTLKKQTILYLSAPVQDASTPGTPLTTTIFIAPNGALQMQDNWTNGSPFSPTDGCPHAALLIGTTASLMLDCTTGTISS
jgi:hypothetical protein